MRTLSLGVFLFYMGLCSPIALMDSPIPEDLDGSGDDLEGSGSGAWPEGNSVSKSSNILTELHSGYVKTTSLFTITKSSGDLFVVQEEGRAKTGLGREMPDSPIPEDLDGSGDDLEGSGSGAWPEGNSVSKSSNILTELHSGYVKTTSLFTITKSSGDLFVVQEEGRAKTGLGREMPDDSNLTFDSRPKAGDVDKTSGIGSLAKSQGFLENKEVLAEDLDGSGDDLEGSGSGAWPEGNSVSKSSNILTELHSGYVKTTSLFTITKSSGDLFVVQEEGRAKTGLGREMPDDSNLTFDSRPKAGDVDKTSGIGSLAKSQGFLENKEVLAEDLDGSGDDLEGSGSGAWPEVSKSSNILTELHSGYVKTTSLFTITKSSGDLFVVQEEGRAKTGLGREMPDDSNLTFDSRPKAGDVDKTSGIGSLAKSQGFLENKEVLAAVVAGGVVGLAFAGALVLVMIYNMKKKDGGSYAVDQPSKPSNTVY